MKLTRKVALAIDLTQKDTLERMQNLKSMDFLNHSEVHFVFVYQTATMPLGFGEYPVSFPTPQDQIGLAQAAEATLMDIAKSALGPQFGGKVQARCLFAEDTHHRMCEYVNEQHIDLVVMWARAKRGIFESSFSNYVMKHTNANVFVMKQK